MLATATERIPTDPGWSYEMKWDGVRALATTSPDQVELRSRAGNDITRGYPELQTLGSQLSPVRAVLDGEIVAIDAAGRSNFQLLQSRMHLREPAQVAELAITVPVTFMIFDLLWFDGLLLTDAPYGERRALLDRLGTHGPAWNTPPCGVDGDDAVATSRRLGFEGVVAKRLDSRYEPGRRSNAWRKMKHQLRQEFVVGGWVPGQGGRANRIGALLVGVYDDRGSLRYAGKVGTGFTEAELDRLGSRLGDLGVVSSAFADRELPRDARFVVPELVAEVRFTEWTDRGHLRQPAYLGLRNDKDARQIRREQL